MRRFQSFEDFSHALRDEKEPNIDINIIKDVTVNIAMTKTENVRRKLVIVAITTLLTLCIGTVAFAADTIVSKWQLFNRKGDIVLEYTKNILTGDDAIQTLDVDSRYDNIAKNIQPHLQKGEGAIIVTKETNGYVEYEEYVEDISLLVQQSTFKFKTPHRLPAGYRFINGMLSHYPDVSDMHQKIADLTEKVKESKAGYVIEKVPLKSDVRQVRLIYSNDDRKIVIHIQKLQSNQLNSFSTVNYSTEVLKIGESEVIHNWSINKDSGMYFIVDEFENQKWLYMISVGSLTQDEVKNLIESMEF